MVIMKILSISIDEKTLVQLNNIQKTLGFKSRSKLLRSAILGITKEYQNLDSLSGEVECIFVITYTENEKNHVSDLIHNFKGIINTEMHHHSYGMGVDILIVTSSPAEAKTLLSTMKKSKCIYSVTYSIIGGVKKHSAKIP